MLKGVAVWVLGRNSITPNQPKHLVLMRIVKVVENPLRKAILNGAIIVLNARIVVRIMVKLAQIPPVNLKNAKRMSIGMKEINPTVIIVV